MDEQLVKTNHRKIKGLTFVCLPLLIALTLARFGHFDIVEQKRGDVEKPTKTFLDVA